MYAPPDDGVIAWRYILLHGIHKWPGIAMVLHVDEHLVHPDLQDFLRFGKAKNIRMIGGVVR